MIVKFPGNVTRVVILDISGIYAHIYDQGYFGEAAISYISRKYSDTTRWRIVVLD